MACGLPDDAVRITTGLASDRGCELRWRLSTQGTLLTLLAADVTMQCRNPIHKAHYELFIRALDAPNVGEGAVCLVHPTCGPTQVCFAPRSVTSAASMHSRVGL